MKNGMRLLAVALLGALCSCRFATPTEADLAKLDLGPPPSMEVATREAQRVLRTWATKAFADGRFEFGDLTPGFYVSDSGRTRHRYAWQLTAQAGDSSYQFYFLGDQLVATARPERKWIGSGYRTTYAISEMHGGGLDRDKASPHGRRPMRYRNRGSGFSQ